MLLPEAAPTGPVVVIVIDPSRVAARVPRRLSTTPDIVACEAPLARPLRAARKPSAKPSRYAVCSCAVWKRKLLLAANWSADVALANSVAGGFDTSVYVAGVVLATVAVSVLE